eukprot:CAMPEP_0198116446 /NCGR_PEP_ID=MMETSP1442-20131203/12393_1 /TAXON_ID= /ORGANISM="Craspedostauros australis, Strain CCMP3328" /LENGTH=405 /DNA_ID=CAMNT_0043774265 /DNA_START=147 /DNA_END=1364 /DNA_ORIENTATION=+
MRVLAVLSELMTSSSNVLVLHSLLADHNAEGISRNTQEILLLAQVLNELDWDVILPHYYGRMELDVYTNCYRWIDILMGVLTVLLMRKVSRHPAASTYNSDHESVRHWPLMVLPCVMVGVFMWLVSSKSALAAFLTTSYLQAAAVIPQIHMYRKNTQVSNFTGGYIILVMGMHAAVAIVRLAYAMVQYGGFHGGWLWIGLDLLVIVVCGLGLFVPSEQPVESIVSRVVTLCGRAFTKWTMLAMMMFAWMSIRANADLGIFEIVSVVVVFTSSLLFALFLALDHFIFNGTIFLGPTLGWTDVASPIAVPTARTPVTLEERMQQPLLIGSDGSPIVAHLENGGTGASQSQQVQQERQYLGVSIASTAGDASAGNEIQTAMDTQPAGEGISQEHQIEDGDDGDDDDLL